MDAAFRKFALLLLFFTVVITLVGFLIMKQWISGYYFTGYLFMPLVLFVITTAMHRYLVIASRGDNRKFTYRFMGATGLKMFIYLAGIAIYLLLDREHAVPFLLSFLILYILYSVFEVLAVLKYLKNNK